MNIRSVFFLTLLYLAQANAYGQVNFHTLPVFGAGLSSSGKGASNVQNNLYDGSATISIPFFQSTTDGISVALTALYNTKGIKVNQPASSIGLGWELSTGYSITRSVKGRPDEKHIPMTQWPGRPGVEPQKTAYWYSYASYPIEPRDNDGEMDKFQLNLNGTNVGFYFSKNGNLVTVPRKNIKIDRIINGLVTNGTALTPITGLVPAGSVAETILDFVVTDVAGNKYYFSRGTFHTEYIDKTVTDATGGKPIMGYYDDIYQVTDEWRIDKIITYGGKTINFNYATAGYQRDLNRMDYTIEHPDEIAVAKTSTEKSNGNISFLTQILLPDRTTVNVSYSGAPRCDEPTLKTLTGINIHSAYTVGSTSLLQNDVDYNLNYAYFNSATPGTELSFGPAHTSVDKNDLRLKLNSIYKVAGGVSQKYYSFDYYTGQTLPRKFSASQDIFGYYNGKVPATTGAFSPPLVSTVTRHDLASSAATFGMEVGVDKTPNIVFAKACILEKITNGAGGSTTLDYDTHSGALTRGMDASSLTNLFGPEEGDGLFLIYQIENDGYSNENDLLTQYELNAGEIFIPGIPRYYTLIYSSAPGNPRTVWMSSGLSTAQPINGSNHGYSKMQVARKKRNAAGTGWDLLSKTVYYFTNCTKNLSNTDVTTNRFNYGSAPEYNQEPFTDKQYYREWALGLPTIIEEYDVNNNLITKTESFYHIVDENLTAPEYTSVKKMQKKIYNNGNTEEVYSDEYSLRTGIVQLTKTKKYVYTSSGYITGVTDYTYDSYNNLKTTETHNSFGELITTSQYYNYDWVPYASSAGPGIAKMNADGLKVPVYSETWRNIGTDNILVKNDAAGMAVSNGLVVAKTTYSPISLNGISSSSYGTFPGGFNMQTAASGGTMTNFQKMSEITAFDSRGNALELKSKGDAYGAVLYDIYSNKSIATIKNAKVAEVAYTSFDGSYAAKGVADENKGRWDFDNNNIRMGGMTTSFPVSGNLVYQLDANASSNIISTGFAPAGGKKYLVSFWTQGGVPVVTCGGVPLTLISGAVSYRSWIHYYCEFTGSGPLVISGVGASVTSGGSTFFIDEVRLHPADAMMNTVCYEPAFGVKSTCDENNMFSIQEYDAFGRVILTRDHFGNIISKTKYVQQDND